MNWALQQKVGSPSGKLVLLLLANRADHTGKCWPGIDGIASNTELSRRTVVTQIQKLEAAGILSVVHRGGTGTGRKSNVYQLHLATEGQCANDAGLSATGAGLSAIDDRLSATVAPEQTINNQCNSQENSKPTTALSVIDCTKLPAAIADKLSSRAWEAYVKNRKELRCKPLTKTGAKKQMEHLSQFTEEVQIAAVAESVRNGWQGVFPEKVKSAATTDFQRNVEMIQGWLDDGN